MKSKLPLSGALPQAETPLAGSAKTEVAKVPVWFTAKHEHRGVVYKKNQEAKLDPQDVDKLFKLGKISKISPESSSNKTGE